MASNVYGEFGSDKLLRYFEASDGTWGLLCPETMRMFTCEGPLGFLLLEGEFCEEGHLHAETVGQAEVQREAVAWVCGGDLPAKDVSRLN